MSPVTHFLISWSAVSCFKIGKKDRILATIAGFAPDIDGMGLGYDLLVKNNGPDLVYWSKYHHALCHNIGFGLLLAVVARLDEARWFFCPRYVFVFLRLREISSTGFILKNIFGIRYIVGALIFDVRIMILERLLYKKHQKRQG